MFLPRHEARAVGLMPPHFDGDYVEGAVKPYLLSNVTVGERPALPMIDVLLSKENAIPPHIFGMLYDSWTPDTEKEGISVFLQGYENRGPENERKRIYYSALTPDLYKKFYAPKVHRFFERLFDRGNAGKPLMSEYYANYFDLYWDLHLGVTGDQIPSEVRQIGASFNSAIGYWFPTLDVVYQNYMKVRELRPVLNGWVDARVQEIADGRAPDADKTIVYHWLRNGNGGENFRRKDIVFECFHNFLALSQWGNTLFNIVLRLDQANGDDAIRSWFEGTMNGSPDEQDGSVFTPLDRFVMELFRTISPNGGSYSAARVRQSISGWAYIGVLTPHLATSEDRRHWSSPKEFDPDRYKTAPTSASRPKERSANEGRCPFQRASLRLEDGRSGEITNSDFGTVYGVVDGTPYPVCDSAGYAPFGFGYRRCPGELLTVEFIKDALRKIWKERYQFVSIDADRPKRLPVGPVTVVEDRYTFLVAA